MGVVDFSDLMSSAYSFDCETWQDVQYEGKTIYNQKCRHLKSAKGSLEVLNSEVKTLN
jgi:hypothetical protein